MDESADILSQHKCTVSNVGSSSALGEVTATVQKLEMNGKPFRQLKPRGLVVFLVKP